MSNANQQSKTNGHINDVSEEASNLVSQLKEDAILVATAQAEQGQQSIVNSIASVASALNAAADALSKEGQPKMAQATEKAAQKTSGLVSDMQEKSISELTADVKCLAKENPTAAIIGGFAAGLVLARFVKASGKRDESQYLERPEDTSVGYGASSSVSTH